MFCGYKRKRRSGRGGGGRRRRRRRLVSEFIKKIVTPSILQSQFIDKGFQKTDNSVDIK